MMTFVLAHSRRLIARSPASVGLIALTSCSVSELPEPTADATDDAASASPETASRPLEGEAPADCGFAPGTELIFAGRSTTATLQVQEVIGDPLSNDPADIYITFDEIEQGDITARQVCTIYADPRFVELTLAPEGWDLDTGRPPAAPAPTSTDAPAPPADGLARDDAIAAARDAMPRLAEMDVIATAFAPAADMRVEGMWFDGAEAVPDDRWLWRVNFRSGFEGTIVYVDYLDGTVYGATDWIS